MSLQGIPGQRKMRTLGSTRVAGCVLFVVVSGAAAGQITIEAFSIRPMELRLGEAFEVSARVTCQDVPQVGYVLRTAGPVDRTEAPKGFDHRDAQNRQAYVSENGSVHLTDNGPRDLDPAKGAFKIRIDTQGWAPGRYDLAFFAHNRPGAGPHIVDSRVFTVVAEKDRVRILIPAMQASGGIQTCRLTPSMVEAGQPCVLRIEGTIDETRGIEVRQTFCVLRERVPPGFRYDPERKTGVLSPNGVDVLRDNGTGDTCDTRGVLEVRIDTKDWTPELYHLEVAPRGTPSGAPGARHVALKVRAPRDRLDVTVSDSWSLCGGTHAERMTRLSDGTLLHALWLSTDDGKTWQRRESGTIGAGATQLRSGRVLGMAYRTLPIEGREGWYRGERYESDDGGKTVRGPLEAEFHVPQAKAAQGHAFHPGPLFMRSIVERPDGTLVALMGGWFKGDDAPCPQNARRPYSRTYVCESADEGKTWRFLSTIGYDKIGSEGYNEASMKALPNGDLITVLRTGTSRDLACPDSPVMVSISKDKGKTWEKPWRAGTNGVFPDVIVLSDGTLAASYGRPGSCIMFSVDGGRTWTDHTVVDVTIYSGYTTIREIAPGTILMAFGTRGYLDPATNTPSNEIRLARIHYRPR